MRMQRPMMAYTGGSSVLLSESHGMPSQRTVMMSPREARTLAMQLINAATEAEKNARARRRERFKGLQS